jgi:putative transposase
MAPSTYYDTKARGPSQRAQRDAELGPALAALWEDNHRVYGVRKLWKPHVGPATTWAVTRWPG